MACELAALVARLWPSPRRSAHARVVAGEPTAPQNGRAREDRRAGDRLDRRSGRDPRGDAACPEVRIRVRRPALWKPIVAVYKMLREVQLRAGVERFRPYDLRHSAATGALAAGAYVRAVQALLGHADLATTAKYLHSSAKRQRAAEAAAAGFGRGVLE